MSLAAAHLAQKLTRPLPIKGESVLRTVAEAANNVLATACLTGRDAQDRLRLLASSCRANASMPSAVKHFLSLRSGSRLRRCRRFLPPVTGDPQQHYPVNRIVGAFSSIRALPRILLIELSQRHRRYSLSKGANTRFLYALS